MKSLFLILILATTVSCQQDLEPSVKNINSIFKTQDFTIRFELENDEIYRMGFLNNQISYFSPQETVRRELSYDDVVLINTFVGDRFRESEKSTNNPAQIEIYNDSKKVVFITPDYRSELENLLTQLKLPYVPTAKK